MIFAKPRNHICAVALAACAALASPHAAVTGAPVTITDATGRAVVINDASRIVSIGGAITEILYATGKGPQIIAVDTTSVHPSQALRNHPNVGYMRQLSAEGVLGVQPTLLLSIEGAGPKETIAVLETAGVPLVSIPDHFSGPGVIEKISMVAAATGAQAEGACLASAVKADLDALEALRAHVTKPVKAMFVLSMAGDRLMVAGSKTAADGMIQLAGAINPMAGFEGYKAVNDEAVIAAAPDAILVMQRGDQRYTPEEVFAHTAFKATPAAISKTLVSLDGLYMLGFGPRTPLAARDIAATIYPQLHAGKLPSEEPGRAVDCSK